MLVSQMQLLFHRLQSQPVSQLYRNCMMTLSRTVAMILLGLLCFTSCAPLVLDDESTLNSQMSNG